MIFKFKMNVKEELTCEYCKDIYNEPVTLNCCGENICKQHLDELISNNSSNKFTCPLCNEENTKQNFSVNKLIQRLVQNELHKFEIDTEYKVVLKNLKKEIFDLETILKDPENIIYEEISELKRQVDLDREQLKSKIDELADDLIDQLESFEKKFKSESKFNLDLERFNSLVSSSKQQLIQYEKCLNLFSTKKEERDEMSSQSEKNIKILQSKNKELRDGLFSNLSIKYKPMGNRIEDSFGKLIIKVSFY